MSYLKQFLASLFFLAVGSALFAEEYTVVSTIPVKKPTVLVVSPSDSFAYVLTFKGAELTPIDLKKLKKAPSIALSGGARFSGKTTSIVFSQNQKMIYALSEIVTPVNLNSQTLLPQLDISTNFPTKIAASPDGQYLCVLDGNLEDSQTESTLFGYLSIYNLLTQQEEPRIEFTSNPKSIAFTSSKPLAYVTQKNNTVIPIDLDAKKARSPINIEKEPGTIAITPDDQWAYVITAESNSVLPIKLSTRKIFPEIPVGLNPVHLAIAPDGNRAYVANVDDKTITPIDIQTRTALSPIQLTEKPSWVAVTPDSKMICVVHSEANLVSLISIE